MAESYNPQGQSDWLWVDDIDDPDAPTEGELAAGVSLGCSITEPTPPVEQANTIPATPLCADVERTLPALATVTPATLVLLRADTADADGFELFDAMKDAKGDTGWLVHVLNGSGDDHAPETGDVVDVWPATINGVSVLSAAGGAPGTWRIDFAHNGAFHPNVVVGGSGS